MKIVNFGIRTSLREISLVAGRVSPFIAISVYPKCITALINILT